jgi:hypothetical protein
MGHTARKIAKPAQLEIEVTRSARVLKPSIDNWSNEIRRQRYAVVDDGGLYKVRLLPKDVQELVFRKQLSFADHGLGFVPPDWIGPDYRTGSIRRYGMRK